MTDPNQYAPLASLESDSPSNSPAAQHSPAREEIEIALEKPAEHWMSLETWARPNPARDCASLEAEEQSWPANSGL